MAQALSGIMSVTGEGDRPPAVVGVSVADYSASLCLTVGVLAALHYRAQTGKGQHVDTSLLDAVVAGLGGKEQIIFQDGQRVPRLGSAHALHVPYQVFLAADGRYVYVAVFNDKFWEGFCAALGLHEWLADPRYAYAADRSRNRDTLVPQVAAVLGQMKAEDIIAALDKAGVPCAPVLDMEEASEDPQVVHNGMRQYMDHPTAGRVKMFSCCPIHFSETPARPQRAAPLLGQHTDEVLAEFGYSADEIASLRKRKVIG
jgi:crotonobetainyl-CoA:carnitine CoA-transferase CaiB-like acyl-CoA transferase